MPSVLHLVLCSILLAACCLLTACRTTPPPVAAVPLDPRLDLLTPPPRYDRQPPLDRPTDPHQQAAGRGLRWLVEHRRADGRWEVPRPIAVIV